MSPRAKWTTSVDELIRLFGDAIRALIPIAERARMQWKAPDSYDDWDHICEAIYRSIVGDKRVATVDAKFNLSCRDRDNGALKLVDELTVSL